jgi:uncharacterized protein YraI
MAKAKPSPSLTASGAVGQNNGVYHGFHVTVTTATAAINIRNGSATGQIVDVIPSGTTAGTRYTNEAGIALDGGIYVDFNGGTGTVVVLYE